MSLKSPVSRRLAVVPRHPRSRRARRAARRRSRVRVACLAQGTDCLITGLRPLSADRSVLRRDGSPEQNPFGVVWSLLNNTAGASFVGSKHCSGVNSCPVTSTSRSRDPSSCTPPSRRQRLSRTASPAHRHRHDAADDHLSRRHDRRVRGSIDPSVTGTATLRHVRPGSISSVDSTIGSTAPARSSFVPGPRPPGRPHRDVQPDDHDVDNTRLDHLPFGVTVQCLALVPQA